ncbi:hypothetical protein D9M70_422660 [compost metagenome]
MVVVQTDDVRAQPTARHGHEAQAREPPIAEAHLLQQFVGIGHARKVGTVACSETFEKIGIVDRSTGNIEAGADCQVRIQHRQAVGIMERQNEATAVIRRQAEIVGDGRGVCGDVLPGQADGLAATGAARCREHHRQLGMRRTVTLPQRLFRAPAAVDPAKGIIGIEGIDPGSGSRVLRGLHRHGMASCQRCQISDDRMFGKLGLDRHQPAWASESKCLAGDPLAEFPISDDPLPGKDQRRPVAPFRQIRNEREGHP